MDRIHSVDVQPDRDGISHTLVINGISVARFADLATALKVREQMVSEAYLQEPGTEEAV